MKRGIFVIGLIGACFTANLRATTLEAAMDRALQNNRAILQAKSVLEKAAGNA